MQEALLKSGRATLQIGRTTPCGGRVVTALNGVRSEAKDPREYGIVDTWKNGIRDVEGVRCSKEKCSNAVTMRKGTGARL